MTRAPGMPSQGHGIHVPGFIVSALRRVLTPAGLAIGIVFGGVAAVLIHENLSAKQAQEFSEAQGVDAGRRVQEAFEHARLETRLLAAEPDLHLMPRPLKDAPSDTALASAPDATGSVTIKDTLRPAIRGNLLVPGLKLELAVNPVAGQAPIVALYPVRSPTHLLTLSAARNGTVAVSAVNLAAMLRDINPDETDYVEFQLSETGSGRVLATTPGWEHPVTNAAATELIPQPLRLTLRTRPSQMYPESITSTHPSWTLVGVLVLAGAIYLLTAKLMAAVTLLREKQAAWDAGQKNHRANLQMTLTNITEAAGTMLWLARPEGDVELYGPWPEMEGRESRTFTFEELTVGVQDADSMLRSLRAAVTERTSWAYTHHKDLDGVHSVFQEGAAPVFTPMGAYLGLIGIRTNVSEVVRAQQNSSKTEEIRAGHENYLSQMSSEISAPAQQAVAALGYLRQAIEKSDAEGTARWLAASVMAAERVDSTVKAALEVMRLKGGSSKMVLTDARLDDCARDVVLAVAPNAARTGSKVVFIGQTARNARFSASGMVRVLTELITNALKFTPAGTSISVTVGEANGRCFVSVADDGPGMSDDELRRITRPFYRTASATNIEGRGLGIPMAKELVDSMGGNLVFARARQFGGGLVATVFVPFANDSASAWISGNVIPYRRARH